jgi:uncharacterized repeat protein (TIGR03809 family)
MTQRPDVARGREIIARWCSLAEQRLDYLTKLYETGRWRRYHSERAFLENIQEAKAAVQAWHSLLTCEAARDNVKIDVSWLGRKALGTAAVLPEAALVSPEISRSVFAAISQAIDVSSRENVSSREKPAEPAVEVRPTEPELKPAVEPERDPINLALNVLGVHNRYPSLRNVM